MLHRNVLNLIIVTYLLMLFTPVHTIAGEPLPVKSPGKRASIEVTPELDAYYSNIGLHIPLTNTPIPDIHETNELKLYKQLFLNSLTPRFMLLEASVFPMPVLGSYLKKYERGFFDSAALGDDLNLISVITTGFQEPYSFSVFFGDIATFVKPGEKRDEHNKGYMGYLFTVADHHIKDNVLINDKLLEIEWKTKGEKNFKEEKLSWSFRLGTKLHENKEISDVAYIGLRRSDLDFNSKILSWLRNSTYDFRWDFGLKDGNILRQEYIVGKKFPFKSYKLAMKLDFGLIWQNYKAYSGELRDKDSNEFLLVVRPNIQF